MSSSEVLTAEDVRRVVERAFGLEVSLLSYKLRPYSKQQVGFLGSHGSLEIEIQRAGAPEKHTFFAKTTPSNCEHAELFVQQHRLFGQEARFYNELVPLLLEGYTGKAWAPKCYLANDELLVLEDVRNQGFVMHDSRLFSGERLKSAARALARLHACSYLADERLPASLLEGCTEQIFERDHKERGLFRLLVELVEAVAREHGQACGAVGPAFERHYRAMQAGPVRNEGRVVSHVDTWGNNFMFSSENCLLIDFQLVRYGKRAWDLAQLVYYSTTKELRQREEMDVLEAYHQEFNAVVRGHNAELKLPSLTDTLAEYEEARLHALFATMFYYPFLLLGDEESRRHEPEDLYKMYIIRVNNEAVLDLMKRDEEYGRRIRETALELAEHCENLKLDKLKDS